MMRGERGRMMEEAKSIASDPRAWYQLMRDQMRNHDEVTKSGWLQEPNRTIEEKCQHWYAGTLLGFDTMAAANRYIDELERRAAIRTPDLTELPKPNTHRDNMVLLTVVLITQAAILALGGWLALAR